MPVRPHVGLVVRDDGPGMQDAMLTRIFEPFFTTKPKGQGTGLGLSVVYTILRRHEGALAVESAPGKSTAFHLFLPLQEDAAPREEPGAPRHVDCRGNGERILVVEDESGVRRVCVRVLREHGYEVSEAGTVAEGVECFDRAFGRLDLVFSDMILPDATGLDLLRALRARKPDQRILLASGYTDQKAHRQAVREIGLELLHKPYDLAELLACIRAALSRERP